MTFYRRDIDGLRAISIIVVLMFHAGFGDWTGGFLGVDVFFVISGFLITSLISAELNAGNFTLRTFYERRVRRLVAATIPVIFFTTVFAWAFFTTDRYLEYAQSLIAFVTYTSNWYFLSVSGYFGGSPETTPLLHTWSLGVEEQFYLVFPLMMLLLHRKPKLIRPVLGVTALSSIVYSQYLLNLGNENIAYFSTLSRFWELMLGALLALSPTIVSRTARFSTIMRIAGLALILVPVFTYSSETPFPGFAALVPVAGTLLLLAAAPEKKDPILAILESGPAVYLGRISYSLYLWHWPVLGAVRTLFFDSNDLHIAIALLLSIGLAALSYHYVEQPIRKRCRLPRAPHMAAMLSATTIACVAIGSHGWLSGGWPGRVSPEAERIAAVAAQHRPDRHKCYNTADTTGTGPFKFCEVGGDNVEKLDLVLWGDRHATAPEKAQRLDLLLLGDSHAVALEPALRRYAKERGASLGLGMHGNCPTLLGVWRSKDPRQVCRLFNDKAMEFIRESDPKMVVIVSRWSAYTNGPQKLITDEQVARSRKESRKIFDASLDRMLAALKGRRVVIVEQVPENRGHIPSAYLVLSRLGQPIDRVAARVEDHRRRQSYVDTALTKAAQRHPFFRIDPAVALCSDPGGACTVQAAGKLLYFDDDHVNYAGSMFLYPFLAAELDKARVSPIKR